MSDRHFLPFDRGGLPRPDWAARPLGVIRAVPSVGDDGHGYARIVTTSTRTLEWVQLEHLAVVPPAVALLAENDRAWALAKYAALAAGYDADTAVRVLDKQERAHVSELLAAFLAIRADREAAQYDEDVPAWSVGNSGPGYRPKAKEGR